MSNRDRSTGTKGPLIWPLAVAISGVLLLAGNFFLLEGFRIIDLWPILPVILGAQILLRGDLLAGTDFRTFGITRGSIESATLEINAGEIDVTIRALPTRNTQRLIAGQYANQARPELEVRDIHAYLTMDRSQTPWLSFADWEMGISQDLPWQIVASTNFGQINTDFSNVIIQNVLINTGIGDIHMVCPPEAFETLYLRSLFGSISVHTPENYNVRISINAGQFFGVNVDESRYEEIEQGVYLSRDSDEDLAIVDIMISGTFGDAYLS